MSSSVALTRPTARAQVIGGIVGIVAAVALPQLFHLVGIASGAGNAPGTVWLPMHLPVIIVGLLLGWRAGLVTGLAAPLISSALTGMPPAMILPFMVLELGAYGLVSGLLRDVKIPVIVKVLVAQVAGRGVYAAAVWFAAAFLGSKLQAAMVLTNIVTGLPGLIVQWALIPLIVFYVNNRSRAQR